MNRLERKKIIQVILGTSMIALAITLLITAHKGADTISVFLLGMLTLIDIPFWVASLCSSVRNRCYLQSKRIRDR